jgi:hypothetical protein
MYVDSLLALSGSISGNTVTGQTVTGTGATVLSTNTVDLASGGIPSGQARDIGEGSDFAYGRFQVTVAASGGTSVEMQIVTADDASLSTNLKVLGTTGAIPVASLPAGARFACQINPALGSKGQRYVGARYITVGAVSAGAYYADIGAEIQDGQKFYPNGFAVL